MTDSSTHIVSASALRKLMVNLFVAAGCSNEAAQVSADVLYEADLRGYGSHGLLRLPNMIDRIQNGMIDPKAEPRIVRENTGSALIDGALSLGTVGAMFGAQVAIRKAKESGCCAVGVVNSNHICMAGYYAEQVARAGQVGILTSVTQPLAHVMGGFERLLGTNPLTIAVPTGVCEKSDPILVDFATTTISFGTVMKSRTQDVPIPEGMAYGPDGRPTTDPNQAYRGALTPFAGHKGYGLSLVLGILAGPLLGAKVGNDLARSISENNHYDKGDLIIAIDPASFGDPEAFFRGVAEHLHEVKSSPLAQGAAEIRIPGERSFAEKEKRLKNGIPIEPKVWAEVSALAEELGVAIPT